MENLKKEINLRYRAIQYKKLLKQYIYNRIEKNNVNICFKAFEDLAVQRAHKLNPYENL